MPISDSLILLDFFVLTTEPLYSDSIQMKHSIVVETLSQTNEVVTRDFFAKADEFIREMGV